MSPASYRRTRAASAAETSPSPFTSPWLRRTAGSSVGFLVGVASGSSSSNAT